MQRKHSYVTLPEKRTASSCQELFTSANANTPVIKLQRQQSQWRRHPIISNSKQIQRGGRHLVKGKKRGFGVLLNFCLSSLSWKSWATAYTNSTHNKQQLDVTKLPALKVLVFSRFPIQSAKEKEKVWKSIKTKINSKCCLGKHVNKLAHSSEYNNNIWIGQFFCKISRQFNHDSLTSFFSSPFVDFGQLFLGLTYLFLALVMLSNFDWCLCKRDTRS